MITIDMTNKRFMKIYAVELSEQETQILALLSDNKYHKIKEISQYINYADAYKIVNQLIEKFDFLVDFEKRNVLGYRIREKVLIK